MVFLRACSWALCLTNDTLFLGKSLDTGRTMTSNTNRSINCKLHHQTRLQPSLHAHMPICYGSASLDVHEHPKLTTPKRVTFSLLVTTPTVFLNVTSTSQTYILPQELVKVLIEKLRGVAQESIFLTNLVNAYAADQGPL